MTFLRNTMDSFWAREFQRTSGLPSASHKAGNEQSAASGRSFLENDGGWGVGDSDVEVSLFGAVFLLQ